MRFVISSYMILQILFMQTQVAQAKETMACGEIKAELAAMNKAQAQIMQSLINNHETFAETLEDYAQVPAKGSARVASDMKKSASAFRLRGQQAQALMQKFNVISNDLIQRAASCIK